MTRRVAAAAVLAGALVGAPAATADTPVVSATVFTGTAGTAAARTVELSALDACPPYTGPGALTLLPGGTTDTLPTGSTWTLAEILECGLQIPLGDLQGVEVQRPDGSAQAPLSPTALSDPAAYADPAALGALPVISNDGGEPQNTYTRPWRGGDDENGRDQVTAPGPVPLLVYENAAPLVVHITPRVLRRSSQHERVLLSATAQSAAGTTIPVSALGWRWTISTGAASAAATPTVTVPQGTTVVTVLVSDTQNGSGGTASIALSLNPVHSPTVHRGGGGGHGTIHSTSGLGAAPRRNRTRSAGGTGRRSSRRSGSTGATGPASRPAGSPAPAATASTPTTRTPTPTPTTSTPSPSPTSPTSTAAAATTTAASPPARRPRAHRSASRHAPARSRARGTVVRGQLLADVVPLSAAQNPLTHPLSPPGDTVASPAAATRLTVPAVAVGAIALLGLLVLGGIREQRRRSPRLHR